MWVYAEMGFVSGWTKEGKLQRVGVISFQIKLIYIFEGFHVDDYSEYGLVGYGTLQSYIVSKEHDALPV
jgi:hypothetical protein